MAKIKATCPTCGEVDLTADDIDLRISAGEEGSTYGFECPLCITNVRKPADSRVIQLLISGGVRAQVLEDPGLDHPPFTYDDLIDFHFQLESDDAIHQFLAGAS